MSTPDPRPAGTPGSDPTLGAPGGDRPSPPPMRSTGPDGPAPATEPARSSEPARSPERGRKTGRTIGRTVALVLLLFVTVVLVLFVVFNTQTVEISLVFTDVRATLVVALLIAAALGALLAWLAGTVLRARRRNR